MRLSLGHFLALGGVQVIALLCAAMTDVVTVSAATVTITNTVHLSPSLAAPIASWSDPRPKTNSPLQGNLAWSLISQ